jgi:hypothetical protein
MYKQLASFTHVSCRRFSLKFMNIMKTPVPHRPFRNVVDKWLALLLRIWEVPGSNLCPEIGCRD